MASRKARPARTVPSAPPSMPVHPLALAAPEAVGVTGHRTSRAAVRVLLEQDNGYHEPSRKEREALQVGFALHQRILAPSAFDILRLTRPVDLLDPQDIAANMDAIEVCEIKSTNQERIKPDLKGYFFNVTNAEMMVAQSLGAQYRLLFVHTVTGHVQDVPMAEVLGRARAIYPAWHLRL